MSYAVVVDPAAEVLTARGPLTEDQLLAELRDRGIDLGETPAELTGTPRLTALIRSGNLNLDAFLDGGKRTGASAPSATPGAEQPRKTPSATPAPTS